MSKLAIIRGTNAWLQLYGKNIINNAVMITEMGDIHPHHNGPIFSRAETVFLYRNDKNFIHYWMDKRCFPMAKIIYLGSHPCEPSCFKRFDSNTTIYLNDFYRTYKRRWAEHNESVILTKDNEKFTEYEEEDVKISEN